MRHVKRLRPRFFLIAFFASCLALLALVPGVNNAAKATKKQALLRAAWQAGPNVVGQWSAPELLDTVPVHISVLPDGRLLYWGRDKNATDSYDVGGGCWTYTWNPTTKAKLTIRNNTSNLFCSGHSFLPDGRLLVAGGHNRYDPAPDREGIGETDINIFDYRTNSWTLAAQMPRGRWYPSTVTMANGETGIFAGSYWDGTSMRVLPDGRSVPSVLSNTKPDMYTLQGSVRQFTATAALPVYPYLHLAPNGQVFLAGPGPNRSRYFDPNGNAGAGQFLSSADFDADHLEASAVTYDSVNGKILMVGGRHQTGGATRPDADVIDLVNNPLWRPVTALTYKRKYHNATLLPDGKVLVTGGTQCQGANDIACPEGPARFPELWNPATESWTIMAQNPSGVPRAYHSIGFLLPDGRVLVGGGGLPAAGGEVANGELCVDGQNASTSVNCRTFGHRDVEIFSPPYLFTPSGTLATRPAISSAPSSISTGQTFSVGTGSAFSISSVVLVRLPSVTHGSNFDQRRVVLNFQATGSTTLSVTAPPNGTICPPGPYMLFILNSSGVPSVSKTVLVTANAQTALPNVGRRVVLNVDNRMQVFYNGPGGALNYSVQTTAGGAQWSAPVSLGGVITSNPVAIANADGRIEVFAKGTDNALYHNWQLAPASSNWSGWVGLGGNASGDPAVARNSDGRLQVFYRGGDNLLYTLSQTTPGVNSWSAHANLFGTLISNPSVVANSDGRLEVFAVMSNNAVNHIWQNTPGANSWSGWFSIGGFTNSQQLAVERNLDGWLQVFFRGAGDNAIHTMKQSSSAPGGWTADASLGGGFTSDPSVGVNADGRLEIFAKGMDNALFHNWQTTPSGTWSGWAGLGGGLTSGAEPSRNADGRLQVVVRGLNNVLYYNSEVSPNSSASWAGFALVGGNASTF
jgi:hypothetical protein